jgi:hypothetical protein
MINALDLDHATVRFLDLMFEPTHGYDAPRKIVARVSAVENKC